MLRKVDDEPGEVNRRPTILILRVLACQEPAEIRSN